MKWYEGKWHVGEFYDPATKRTRYKMGTGIFGRSYWDNATFRFLWVAKFWTWNQNRYDRSIEPKDVGKEVARYGADN